MANDHALGDDAYKIDYSAEDSPQGTEKPPPGRKPSQLEQNRKVQSHLGQQVPGAKALWIRGRLQIVQRVLLESRTGICQ